MRFVILTEDYAAFLRWFSTQHRGLDTTPYTEQLRMRRESLYNEACFFADSLQQLGHDAQDIYVNNAAMQQAWAREHGYRFRKTWGWELRLRRGIVPWLSRIPAPWFYDILAAQIRYYQPEVLVNQAMNTLSSRFLQEMKPHIGMLIGQHAASPLPQGVDVRCYDLLLSSFPPTVEALRAQGIPAALQRLGFGRACGACLDGAARPWDLTFIGSFLPIHRSRVAWLEALCARFPQLKVWAQAVDHLAPASSIRSCYQGQAWGRDMYSIFARSKITLNHHGDILPYANNVRLYEATGMGALLLTDWKANLHEMFAPGTEVVAYRSVEECLDLIQYYLDHPGERDAIARAGQAHTLRAHTYDQRAQELVEIVGRYR